MPKIFVGVPCGEFMHSRTSFAQNALIAESMAHHDLVVHGGFAGDVAQNQNTFAHFTLQTNSDYLLLIETDMLFPPDALLRMLAHERDVVGVLYRFREPPHDVMLWDPKEEVPREGLLERPAVPAGLMLIAARVFKAFPCPWFYKSYTDRPNSSISSDRNFCDQATKAGFHVFADCALSYEVAHIGSWPIPLDLKRMGRQPG